MHCTLEIRKLKTEQSTQILTFVINAHHRYKIQLDDSKQISEIPLKIFQTWLQQTITTTIVNEMGKVRQDLAAEMNNLKLGSKTQRKKM